MSSLYRACPLLLSRRVFGVSRNHVQSLRMQTTIGTNLGRATVARRMYCTAAEVRHTQTQTGDDKEKGNGSSGKGAGGTGGAGAEDAEEPLSSKVKWRHFFACAMPMVGFGAMDNTIMIHAGDMIDNFFGHYLRFTLVAAAFGQLFSDVAGVMCGGTVEAFAARCGFTSPRMTSAQRSMRSTRLLGTLGSAIGVMVGCCLGMGNLFFLDLEKAERMKQAEKMRSLFDAIISEGWELVNCDRCTLYLLADLTKPASEEVADPTHLFTMVRHGVYPTQEELEAAFKYATGLDPQDCPDVKTEQLAVVLKSLGWEAKRVAQMLPDVEELTYDEFGEYMTAHLVQDQCSVPLRRDGTKWHVVQTGEALNVADVYADNRFKDTRFSDNVSGYQSRSILVGPVKDRHGKVIGLVEMINKLSSVTTTHAEGEMSGLEVTKFSDEDEKLLHLMCAHCATFISHVMGQGEQ